MNPAIAQLLADCSGVVQQLDAVCTQENLDAATDQELRLLEDSVMTIHHKLGNKRMVVYGVLDQRAAATQLGGS